ncbi:hypothetical protein COC46_20920 [Bacillus sp. AFS041924]|nr:hypothetical protein COC46_20920 [Bacillus sp. AFS041924]
MCEINDSLLQLTGAIVEQQDRLFSRFFYSTKWQISWIRKFDIYGKIFLFLDVRLGNYTLIKKGSYK